LTGDGFIAFKRLKFSAVKIRLAETRTIASISILNLSKNLNKLRIISAVARLSITNTPSWRKRDPKANKKIALITLRAVGLELLAIEVKASAVRHAYGMSL